MGPYSIKPPLCLAFNAPYYLDTTEVTKLTAYYGVYSKTQPHIEAAVRAIFGEITSTGSLTRFGRRASAMILGRCFIA